jgi:hypothetical protein
MMSVRRLAGSVAPVQATCALLTVSAHGCCCCRRIASLASGVLSWSASSRKTAWESRTKRCCSWVLMSARDVMSVRVGGGFSAQTQQTDLARSLDREHALVVGHSRVRTVATMLRCVPLKLNMQTKSAQVSRYGDVVGLRREWCCVVFVDTTGILSARCWPARAAPHLIGPSTPRGRMRA